MKKFIRPILLVLLVVFLGLQLFQIDKTSPATDPAQDYLAVATPPAKVATLLKQACYDCHSNNTAFPWYTYIQPVGWWVNHHIEEGKEHLNFSVWATYQPKRAAHKLEECYEVIESTEMPMKSYTWMHAEAKLTQAQRDALVRWFRTEYQKMESNPAETPTHSSSTESEAGEHEESTHE